MTDTTKLDTRSLSAEEEAILDACFRGNIHDLGSAIVCYGRALFGQGESEAKATRDLNRLPEPAATDVFATDRAIGVQAMNAEDVPAATEMPEAVRKVCHRLRHLAMTSAIACRIGDRDEFDEYADALESWWRTHAQPVANVAPKKLEKVRDGIVLLIHKAKNDPRVGINHYEAMLKEMLDELDAYERGGREGK